MIETLAPDVFKHAKECAPNECCGLAIVVKGMLIYWPCRNDGRAGEFVISSEDYAAAEDAGEIVGICHSHPFATPEPSQADLVMIERTQLPWLIVSYPTGSHTVTHPSGYVAPLIGRQFVHGVTDCYQIIKDYYQARGVNLPDPVRADDWWHKGQNLYLDNFEDAGFVIINELPKKHDVLLMQVSSKVPNHGAVYIGDGQIIQHCHGRLSSRDVYGGFWRKVTTHVLRHRVFL